MMLHLWLIKEINALMIIALLVDKLIF